MAHATKLDGRWELAAKVLTERAEHELSSLREQAKQSQQVFEECATMSEDLFNKCTERLKRIREDIRGMVAREIATQGLASQGTPAKRPATPRAPKQRTTTK